MGLQTAQIVYSCILVNWRYYSADDLLLDVAHNAAAARRNGLWWPRQKYCRNLPTLESVITNSGSGCVVVGNFGVGVPTGGPGSSGASIGMLARARRIYPNKHVIAPVIDPEALSNCLAAGTGLTVH